MGVGEPFTSTGGWLTGPVLVRPKAMPSGCTLLASEAPDNVDAPVPLAVDTDSEPLK